MRLHTRIPRRRNHPKPTSVSCIVAGWRPKLRFSAVLAWCGSRDADLAALDRVNGASRPTAWQHVSYTSTPRKDSEAPGVHMSDSKYESRQKLRSSMPMLAGPLLALPRSPEPTLAKPTLAARA